MRGVLIKGPGVGEDDVAGVVPLCSNIIARDVKYFNYTVNGGHVCFACGISVANEAVTANPGPMCIYPYVNTLYCLMLIIGLCSFLIGAVIYISFFLLI